jgi:hypothetical protein
VPEHLRDQVRVECDAGPGQLTTAERRPPWHNDMGTDRTRFPITRLRYTTAAKHWSLYWRDRHPRFHRYGHLPATAARRSASSTRSTTTPPPSSGDSRQRARRPCSIASHASAQRMTAADERHRLRIDHTL